MNPGIRYFLFSCLCTAAHADVTGIVMDSTRNTPLAGVSIQVHGGAGRAATDAQGRFQIKGGTTGAARPAPGTAGPSPWTETRFDVLGRFLEYFRPRFPKSGEIRKEPLAKASAAGLHLILDKTGYAGKTVAVEDGSDITVRMSADTNGARDGACSGIPAGGFCDDFLGNSVDTSRWWYVLKSWGPPPPRNHGVIPENVSVQNGLARFAGNGDRYSGPLQGVYKSGGRYYQDRPGTRSGGVLVTDGYFGSGRYEVRLKLPPKTGVCAALWTFHYQEIYEGQPGFADWVARGYHVQGNASDGRYVVVNHEIDIETPTAAEGDQAFKASYGRARFNTWQGETGVEFTDNFDSLGSDHSDGRFHVFRFDWHTAATGPGPRVDFYVDGVLKRTNSTHIPSLKGRFWIGTWFPEWAGGTADFDVQQLEVDWVRITPFHESGDQTLPETYPDAGLTKCRYRAANDANLPVCVP